MEVPEDSLKSLNENAENGTGDSSMNYILKRERTLFFENQEKDGNKLKNTKKLEPENKRLSDGPVIQTNRFKHDFECLKELGKGGFGKVFEAKHRVADHIYAVKRIPLKLKECFLVEQDLDESECEVIQVEGNQVLKEFLREVKLLADLQHKNIVRYHCSWFEPDYSDSYSSGSSGSYESTGNGSDETPDSSDSASMIKVLLYIKMELCSTNLQKWLEKRNTARVQFDKDHEAIRIFKELVEAITYLHEKELMHRDLKPANILLTGTPLTVKIGDFGLSKYMWEDMVEQGRVRGAYPIPEHTPNCGTELYAAPEMFQRSDDACSKQEMRRDYNCMVDIYSLGIILFEMCSDFGSGSERIKEVTTLRDGSKCCDGFKQSNEVAASLIEKLIHKDPEKRPTAAQILNDELFRPKSDVDMFSFGVILIDLNTIGITGVDKAGIVDQLLNGSECPDVLKQRNKLLATLIEQLIQTKPDKRPTAAQILKDGLFRPESDNTSLSAGDTKWRTTEENVALKIVAGKDRENILLQKTTTVNHGAGDAMAAEGLQTSGDTATSGSIPLPDMLGLKMKD